LRDGIVFADADLYPGLYRRTIIVDVESGQEDACMSSALQFDDQASRRIEAIYMTPDVVAQRHAVLQALALSPGEHVVDVGPGPGFLLASMADAVGPTGRVHGVDMSASMLSLAQVRCAAYPWIAVATGDATRLPLAENSIDVAVSTQVYAYVSDVPAAVRELHRILRPTGRALILDTDWDSVVWHSSDRARMERFLDAWRAHVIHPNLPPHLSAWCREAGFRLQHRAVVPLFNPELDPNTFSHGLIDLIATFVVGRQGITQDETDMWSQDLHALGAAGHYFFSLNRYLFLMEKAHP
jgi:arsenite methyltransferase